MSVRANPTDREQSIKELCSGSLYSFSHWVEPYKNASTKFICKCEIHGMWPVSVHNFINNNRRCPGCQKDKTSKRCRSDEQVIVEKINSVNPKYRFVKWSSRFSGTKSKFDCQCVIHGVWSVSVLHYLYQRTGCPSCAGLKPYSQRERETQIVKACATSGVEFVGWVGLYKNSYSKFEYRCLKHGLKIASVNDFVNSGTRCPGCSTSGYKKDAKGYLYLLDSGDALKVGVSNDPLTRLKTLKRKTPFAFSIVKIHTGLGSCVRELEKLLHSKYPSTGYVGFDGATEWLSRDEALIAEFMNIEVAYE